MIWNSRKSLKSSIITAYDRTSRGAEAYTAFAAEFLKKQSA